MAGLADVLLVVEAGEHSGTRTTASQALDQGKTVYVVPGDITRPMSVGCNRLIAEGASVFMSYEDIAYEVVPKYAKLRKRHEAPPNLSPTEQAVYAEIKSGNITSSGIMRKLTYTPSQLNSALTSLELRSLIASVGIDSWAPV